MRAYLALTTCGLLVLLSGCAAGRTEQPTKVAPSQPNAVVALGRIQPNGDVIKLSVANAPDSRIDKILIKEGDFVKQNQVIAILQGIDRKQAEVNDALADVKVRQIELGKVSQGDFKKSQITAQNAVLARLQAQLTSTRTQQQAALVGARSQLQNADANYQRQLKSDRQGVGLLTAQAKLTNAVAEYRRRSQFERSGNNTLGSQAKLANTKAEYQRKLTVYQSGGISKSVLDKAQEEFISAQAAARERGVDTKTQLDKASEDLAAAKANLQEKKLAVTAQLDKLKTELSTARETVNQKQAELDQTIHTLKAEIDRERAKLAELREVRPNDVRLAQAQLEKAQIAVKQKQANLRDSQVRVPVAGQILKINTRIGEQVNITQGIVELAQTNKMYVMAEIAEIDINKIRQGQTALIASEYNSFAGEIRGTVSQIGLQVGRKQTQEAAGNNPTTDKESRIIAVKIEIAPADSPKVAKLTNMQVRVRLPIRG
jgi:HlyD family secretion protein